MPIQFNSTSKLLFIGDSITDCGWRADPEQLGQGYVRIVRDYLCAKAPASAPLVINRGISGNKIPDLQKRWRSDVLELSPDVLSIYIGINDVWHGLIPGRSGCDLESYIAGYRDILRQTRQSLPGATIILCEPSVLWLVEYPHANDRLKPYVEAVNQLAGEYQAACVVALHNEFGRAQSARPNIDWTRDGVHPTSAGHMLIARTWLAATGLLT